MRRQTFSFPVKKYIKILLTIGAVFLLAYIASSLTYQFDKGTNVRALSCDTSVITTIFGIDGQPDCLQTDQLVYKDDPRFTWWQIPSPLQNTVYIKTANISEKNNTSLSWSLTLNRQSKIYILYRDAPNGPRPSWLTRDFQKISNTLQNSVIRKNTQENSDTHTPGNIGVYDVYEQKAAASVGPYTFGPAAQTNGESLSMYVVAIIPDPSSPVPTTRPTQIVQPTSPPGGNGGFYIQGNTIYQSRGQPHRFRGVARPSFEWSASGQRISLADYQLIKSWGFNLVRLPVNQVFWNQNTGGYKEKLDQSIAWIQSLGMDVMIDLHWSDKGGKSGAGQQFMADTNSLLFWKDVARRYKHDTRMLFELYNEPHDVSWQIWKNGGQVGTGADSWTAVGMQQMYDAIRAEGAQNIIVIGGLNWAFDLSGIGSGYRIQGNNIAYATHPYNFGGKNTENDWNTKVGYLAKTDPIIITEFGDISGNCDGTFVKRVLDWSERNSIHWVGWAWYVSGCTFPSLVSDWNGTPTAAGSFVKQYLSTN